MAHTYTDLIYHVVFSTKGRAPFVVEEIRARLWAYIGGIVRQMGGDALLVNGTTDHAHMLLHLPPTVAVANAVRDIKANSSGWVHDEWPARRDFAWRTGYGAFTVSESRRDSVLEYIAAQPEHHKVVSFKEEFLALLRRHKIAYDERCIWD